jgi:hypothetical protein
MSMVFNLPSCARIALAALLACLLLTACVTTTGQQIADVGASDLAAAVVCCKHLSEATRRPFTVTPEPISVVVDRQSQAFEFGGTKAFFVMFELPPYTAPWSFTVTSLSQGTLADSAIFVPRVMLFDAAFQPTRVFDEKTLRSRGQSVERTVFINPANAGDRYVALVGSALTSAIQQRYSYVTSTPMMAGPVMFNLVGGAETTGTVRSAPVGQVRIEVHGLSAATPASR